MMFWEETRRAGLRDLIEHNYHKVCILSVIKSTFQSVINRARSIGKGRSCGASLQHQNQQESEDRYPLTGCHASHHWHHPHPILILLNTFVWFCPFPTTFVAYINDFFLKTFCLTSDTINAPTDHGQSLVQLCKLYNVLPLPSNINWFLWSSTCAIPV